MSESELISKLHKPRSLIGKKRNFILLNDLLKPNDFNKNYAVVEANLFNEGEDFFDAIIATTNMFSQSNFNTYFIPIISSENTSNLHRVEVDRSFNVYSRYIFSRVRETEYPELIKIDDYGYYNVKSDFLTFSLQELGLNRSDLNFITSVFKKYSSKHVRVFL